MRKLLFLLLLVSVLYSYELKIDDPVAGPRSSLNFNLNDMFSSNPPSQLCSGDSVSLNGIADFALISSGFLTSICSSNDGPNDCDVSSYTPLLLSNRYPSHDVAILPSDQYNYLATRGGAGWGYPIGYYTNYVDPFRSTLDNLYSKYGFYTGARLVNKPNVGTEVHFAKTRLVMVCSGSYRVEIIDSNGNVIKTYSGDLSEFEDDNLNYRFENSGDYTIEYSFNVRDCVGFVKEFYNFDGSNQVVLHSFVDKTSFNTPVIFTHSVSVNVGGSGEPLYRAELVVPCASVYGPSGGLLYVTCSCYELERYSDSDYNLVVENNGDQPLEIYYPQDPLITVDPDVLKNFNTPPRNFVDPNTRLLGIVPAHSKNNFRFNVYAYAKPEARGTIPYVCIPMSFVYSSSCGSNSKTEYICVYANICEDDNPSDWEEQTGLKVNIDLKPDEITVENYDSFDVKITGDATTEPGGYVVTTGTAHLDALYKRVPDPTSRVPDKVNCLPNSDIESPVNNGKFEMNIPHDKLSCDIDLGEDNSDLVAEVTVTSDNLRGSGSDSSPIDTKTGQNRLPSCDLILESDSTGDFNAESEEKFHFTVNLKDISETDVHSASYDCGDGNEHLLNSLEFDCSYNSLDLRDSTFYAKYRAEYEDRSGKTQSFECSIPVGVCVIYIG